MCNKPKMNKQYEKAMNEKKWLKPLVETWLNSLLMVHNNLEDVIDYIHENLSDKHTEIVLTDKYLQIFNSSFVVPNKHISKKWKTIISNDLLKNNEKLFSDVSFNEYTFTLGKFKYNADISSTKMIKNIRQEFYSLIMNAAMVVGSSKTTKKLFLSKWKSKK